MIVNKARKIYTVSEVNYFARQTLEQLALWVEGEISRCDKSPSYDFYYLTLKDDQAVIPAIIDGAILENLQKPLIGKKIIAYGNLSLYEPRAQYQLRISLIEDAGEGILQKQLEESIKKLKAEGLFDLKFKKEIPQYPKKVCLVTSYNSDAFNDFKSHTAEKFPIIELYCADVRVQGPQATRQLLYILPRIDKLNFDVVVITRGGGSLEDLAAFNDEKVAREIYAMQTPVIVAIGHEMNESVVEWVADVRASTPTDAANIVTSSYSKLLEKLEFGKSKLAASAHYFFEGNFQKLDFIYNGLKQARNSFKDLPYRLLTLKQQLKINEKNFLEVAFRKTEDFPKLLLKSVNNLVNERGVYLNNLDKALRMLSPINTLSRGYAIATDSQGKVVKSAKDVVVGSTLGVKLSEGRLSTIIKKKIVDD